MEKSIEVAGSAGNFEDFNAALKYYRAISEELEGRFRFEFDQALLSLKNQCSYEVKFDGVRFYHPEAFPYVLHFRVNELDKQLFVVGIYFNKNNKAGGLTDFNACV